MLGREEARAYIQAVWYRRACFDCTVYRRDPFGGSALSLQNRSNSGIPTVREGRCDISR